MHKIPFYIFALCSLISYKVSALDTAPDTVHTGIYITSIHDIDFKQKEYTVTLWLWLKYKNKEFDFLQNLEIPQAKTFSKSFSTIDTSENRVYILMKLQCVMKDSWQINNFPFDKQNLRLSFENSQFDSHSLIFFPDSVGNHYDPRFTLSGWNINSLNISTSINGYETAFGDDDFEKPHSDYSAYRVAIEIHREAVGLFFKMFLGMYVAFLIAFLCFFIDSNVEARFGLSVGAVFAVVGNKYIIDSALPESSSFTMVDMLHSISLLSVFAIIASSVYVLSLIKKGQIEESRKFDRMAATFIFSLYFILNVYFISAAVGR